MCFCPVFSEVLYEDEAFKQRQLSALLASKVCALVQMLYCLVENVNPSYFILQKLIVHLYLFYSICVML